MAVKSLCKIDGCGKSGKLKRGWCEVHYDRWRRNGDPLKELRRPKGEKLDWLFEQLVADTDGCILWPFDVTRNGYASVYWKGKTTRAHRVMCTLAHGDPPDGRDSDAAHSCGDRLCVNQRHIRWATRSENHLDKVGHGTDNRGEKNPRAKLTADDVLSIRGLRGKQPQREIARSFGIDQSTVCKIQKNEDWHWLT